jgi:hypothetical protein
MIIPKISDTDDYEILVEKTNKLDNIKSKITSLQVELLTKQKELNNLKKKLDIIL